MFEIKGKLLASARTCSVSRYCR